MLALLGLGLLVYGFSSKKEEKKPQKTITKTKILKFKEPKYNEYIENLAKEINVRPEWIFGIMTFETARTLSPSSKVNCTGYGQKSQYNFCCGGLIGFCPVYANGAYIDGSKPYQKGNLLERDIEYQLKYVRKFFIDGIRAFGKIKSKLDCYLLVFNPASIKYSSNPNHILGSKGDGNMRGITDMNPAFRDEKNNGWVTIRKINEVINDWF